MSTPAVRAEKLTRKFGDFTAVDAISFGVEKGEIYGFLGANGAGKSTTIRMLCGLLEPTSGDAEVAGFSVMKSPEEVKKRLGYMSQKFSLYSLLTVDENLAFFGGLYGLDARRIEERRRAVEAETELSGYGGRRVATLPGGLKQRVALASALLHEPELLFLDEPTAGVDPLLRRRFWEIIDGLSRRGTTVFVTTHYMDEVEHCHRLALMNAGRIIAEGTVSEIKAATFPLPIVEIEPEDVVKAYAVLREKEAELGAVALYGATIHIVPRDTVEETERRSAGYLRDAGIGFGTVTTVEPSMEDAFVRRIKSNG